MSNGESWIGWSRLRASTVSRAVLATVLAMGAFAARASADGGTGATLPPNFFDEPVVSGLDQPVHLTTLPDGRMLVAEKAGVVRVFDPAVLPAVATTYLTLPDVDSSVERGLASLALDPDFAANGHFYVYYTHGTSQHNRLSRFTEVGGVADAASELVLWVQPEQVASCCHYGGGLDVGPDGRLYLTTGDMFDGAAAQDLSSSLGKILRFNTDGTVPAGNPFFDGPGPNLDEVWALGLRNPYRAHWDLVTDRFYVSEVGGNVQATASEDLHLGTAGANFGWPFCEGECADPSYSDPVFAYPHSGGTPAGGAIMAGFTYWGSQLPSEYLGAFFLADYAQDWIGCVTFDAGGQAEGLTCLLDTVDAVVGLAQGPEGAVYYAQITGQVRRLAYVDPSGNQPPTITGATASPDHGPEPLTVTFQATATDPETDPLTYRWTFGDGAEATGNPVQHVYGQVGEYDAYVQVSDGARTTTSEPLRVQVGNPPVVEITSPIDGATFQALDLIAFAGGAIDAEDGVLPESAYRWTVRFLHNAHTHPVYTDRPGSSGSFPIEDSGHDYFDQTGYELTLTATDSDGLSTSSSVRVYPEKVLVSFATDPPGGTILLDGVALETPLDYDTLVGFRHVVGVPQSACFDGASHDFAAWTDGGAATHEITVPTFDTSLTASYLADGGTCGAALPANGLVLHLEADQGVAAPGGVLTGWADLSTRVNDLVAAGGPTLVPDGLGGHPTVRFDGDDDALERVGALNGFPAGNQDRTMFAVVRYDSFGWGGVTFGEAAGCNGVFGLTVSRWGGYLAVQHFCADLTSGVVGTGAGWMLHEVVLEDSQVTHLRDGAVVDQREHFYETQLDRLVLGAELDGSPHVEMELAAVVLYDRALTTSERVGIEQYLRTKYLEAGPNQPPFADDDQATVQQGLSVSIDVLAGDVDPEGALDPWSLSIVDAPLFGSATIQPDHTVLYFHDGSATTVDSFTYVVSDAPGAPSNLATVTVDVTPQAANQPPVADDDTAAVLVGGTVDVDVLDGDVDPEGALDPGSLELVDPPVHGQVTLLPDDRFRYVHDGSAAGDDAFTYLVRDVLGVPSAPATVSIAVLEVGPVADGLVLHLDAGLGATTTGATVTGWTDLSPAGNDLVASGAPSLGATGPGGTPAIAFDGVDDRLERLGGLAGLPAGNGDRTLIAVLRYDDDGWGGVTYGDPGCAETFGLAVASSSGRLAVQHWCGDFVSGEPGQGEGWLMQSVVVEASQMRHFRDGTLIDSRSKTYQTLPMALRIGAEIDGTPHVKMQVAEVLAYDRALTDGERLQLEQYLQEKYFGPVVNQPPIAVDDALSVLAGDVAVADVLANDADPEGQLAPESLAVVAPPTHGTVTVLGDHTLRYAHDGSATTTDAFTYTVADVEGEPSAPATVTVTIVPLAANLPPIADDDSASLASGGSAIVDVLTGDVDPEGALDPASLVVVQEPAHGVATILPDHTVRYQHDGSTATADTFRYTVADTQGAPSNVATVTLAITPVGLVTDGLVLHLDAGLGLAVNGTAVTGWTDLTGNGVDLLADGAPSSAATTPSGLPAVAFDGVDDRLSRTGGIASLPAGNADRTMVAVLRYDGAGWGGVTYGTPSCSQTFGLAVAKSSGLLAAQHWCADFVSTEPGTGAGWLVQTLVHEAGFLRHFKDGVLIDTRSKTYSTTPTSFVVGSEIDGTPFVPMQVAEVLVYDRALSDVERQQLDLYLAAKHLSTAANQPPTADDDTAVVFEGGTVDVPVLVGDADPEGALDPTSVEVVDVPGSGIATALGDGTIRYVHDGSPAGTDSFTYLVRDVLGEPSAPATVTVTVLPAAANEPPVADDEFADVLRGGFVDVVVLDGDVDPEGQLDPTSLAVVGAPTSGTATVRPDHTIRYEHDGSPTSVDSFTYTVADLQGVPSAPATVTLSVVEVPSLPAGVVLHLDAGAGVTASGAAVVDWQDVSGSGNHLAALGAPTLEPTGAPGALPAVAFDGVDDSLVRFGLAGLPLGNADRSMFALVRYRGEGWGGVTYGTNACGRTFGLAVSRGTARLAVQNWCRDEVSGTTAVGAGWLVQSVVHQAGQMRHFADGVQIDEATKVYATTDAKLALGVEIDGTPHVAMDVAEVLLFDRALDEGERALVEQYFQAKYDLP